MTLISDLIHVPDVVHQGDFVLDLARGVADMDRTLRDYVVTPKLAVRFEEALALINSAVNDRSSKAAYLDGSFGSGKSHFMAVLHALLQNHPTARGIGALAPVVAKYEHLLGVKKFLMIPYHLVGKQTLEEAIFSGYLTHVAQLHPGAPPPAVLIDTPLIETGINLREKLGDVAFFSLLGAGDAGADGWGDLAVGWDADRFKAACGAAPGSEERVALVAALSQALTGFGDLARSAGTGYVNIDDGLAAISQHARDLGYDGLVLFLDELILWFATRMSDHAWVAQQAPRVSKLVESANANRPIPIISFVARQRDLREFVGTNLPGTEHLAFADSLKWWEGRFGSVKLSDNNLPVIAANRVLRPRSDTARVAIDTAFAGMDQVRQDIRATLMTSSADRAAFRLTYPFSPAFVETLIALSGALQRERTALRVMQLLLVDQRDTLTLGQLVPVSDLFDVLVAEDEPVTGELGTLWRNAQKVYAEIRRVILETRGVAEDAIADLPLTHAFHRDDRIAKTLVLGALMPEVPSIRELTARKIVALNHGYIRSMVPGQEHSEVLSVVRGWAARLGIVQLVGDEASPLISVRLEGVNIEGVLEKAKAADSPGARRQTARTLLFTALGAPTDGGGIEQVTPRTVVWRGTRRILELVYGDIRDPGDLGDGKFIPGHDGWRVVLDFPFDTEGQTPGDDLQRARTLLETRPARTLCWLPRHLTAQSQQDLARYVRLNYALGQSFDSLTLDMSDNDRALARQQMTAQRDQLTGRLQQAQLQAYGVATPDETLVDTSHGGLDMFFSLLPGFTPKVPAGASLAQALENLADQMLSYDQPAHPRFGTAEVRTADLRKVHAQVRRAIEDPQHRIMVESGERPLLLRIAQPLKLGEQSDQYFLLGHHWPQYLGRRIAEAGLDGQPVTVGQIRAWLDEPERMGLPAEAADLVVLLFAEQTNRSVVAREVNVDTAVLQSLPSDAVLMEQRLPSEVVWEEARARAAAIFGISEVTELRTARNVRALSERLQAAGTAHQPAVRDLVHLLRLRDDPRWRPGREANDFDRMRTTFSALDMLSALVAAPDHVARLDALAEAALPVESPLHLGRTISTAATVATAIKEVDWTILTTVASWEPGHPEGAAAGDIVARVAVAWQAGEWITPLQPALRAADAAARALLIKITQVKTIIVEYDGPTGPEIDAPRTTVVANQSHIAALAKELEEQIRQGRRVTVTWALER